jgi:chitodextrinase
MSGMDQKSPETAQSQRRKTMKSLVRCLLPFSIANSARGGLKTGRTVAFKPIWTAMLTMALALTLVFAACDNPAATTPDTTPPAGVTGLDATPGNAQATLAWTDPTDADLASIEIAFNPAVDGVTQPITVNKDVKSRIVTGLVNGTEYTFTVKAVDDAGNKSVAATTKATPVAPDTTPPANVTGLAPTAGSGQVTLTWADPADNDLASLEITFTPTATGIDQPIIVAKGAQSQIVRGLAAGTEYTFTVIAVDASGNKNTGATTKATPPAPDTTPPANVTGLDATPGNGQATLTWTTPTDNDLASLEITFTPAVTGIDQPITVAKSLQSQVVTGLANGTEYTFTVIAVDASGNKNTGATVKATPREDLVNDTTPPAEVTGLAANPGDGRTTLSWTAPADADFARVEITFSPGGAQSITVAKGVQSRTITGLSNGTTYTFTVKAVDASGNTSAGTTTTATPVLSPDTTPPANVAGLTAIPGDRRATLAWTDPADSDLDYIEITFSPNGTQPIIVAKGTQSRTVTGLNNGTEYTFTVVAVDSSGNKNTGATTKATPAVGDKTVVEQRIEEGSAHLIAKRFDNAIQSYESAYAADNTDPAAIVYSSIAKLASIAKSAEIKKLMEEQFGVSSYPGAIDELLSDSWLREYDNEHFVSSYGDYDGWVSWRGKHPKADGIFSGAGNVNPSPSLEWELYTDEYDKNGPGYYRQELVKNSLVWVHDDQSYGSGYYDYDRQVYLYWLEEGQSWYMYGEDVVVEQTGYQYQRHEERLVLVSKTPIYEIRGYSRFPAFDIPQWIDANGDYDASLTEGLSPSTVTMQLLLFSNLLDKNTDGLNNLLDQTLAAVFGTEFEEAANRVAKLNYTQSVFLDETIVNEFGLTEIFEGDIVITKVEMELLIASMRLVKAALEWVDAYDWNTDLNFLKVNWVNDTDSSYDALLNNIRNTIPPLKNNFLKDRNPNNGKMDASKQDFIKAIDAAIEAYNNIDKVELIPPGAKDEITKRQWIKAGLEALKSAINGGQTFWIPDSEPAGSGWNYSEANGAIGVDLGRLFTPGYLSLDKLIENTNGTPNFYGFPKNGGDPVRVSTRGDIANYEAFGFKFKTDPLYGSAGVVVKIDGADVPAEYVGSLFSADIAEALWDAYH